MASCVAGITQIGTCLNFSFFYFYVCDNLRIAVNANQESKSHSNTMNSQLSGDISRECVWYISTTKTKRDQGKENKHSE